MKDIGFIMRIFSVTVFILLSTACNASPTTQSNSDFDKLCDIYKAIAAEYKDTKDPSIRRYNLALRIQTELPNITDDYKHIISVDRNERYQLLKQVAETRTKKQWDCPAIESYYSGENSN